MKVDKTGRGFEVIWRQNYGFEGESRLIQQSSAVGDYEDSFERPGTSFLWIGDHHLNREEVAELVKHLSRWLEGGKL